MPNVFHPAMNTLSRVSIYGALLFIVAVIWLLWALVRSPYATEAGVIREQPVPFSHKHHVADVGIDCRYCHNSVEEAGFAGIPATSVCMNCHANLFRDQAMLAPVRESYRNRQPLHWTRVHNLGDFAYFNHSIHLHKGIGCVTCHGQVDRMPLMWREHSLLMEWCLACHRNPLPNLRPREFNFEMKTLDQLADTEAFRSYLVANHPDLDPQQPDLAALQQRLASEYGITSVTNCSKCHW